MYACSDSDFLETKSIQSPVLHKLLQSDKPIHSICKSYSWYNLPKIRDVNTKFTWNLESSIYVKLRLSTKKVGILFYFFSQHFWQLPPILLDWFPHTVCWEFIRYVLGNLPLRTGGLVRIMNIWVQLYWQRGCLMPSKKG